MPRMQEVLVEGSLGRRKGSQRRSPPIPVPGASWVWGDWATLEDVSRTD